MNIKVDITKAIVLELEKKYKRYGSFISIPPPVFLHMNGKVMEYDPDQNMIKILFPIKEMYLNPFGSMQGGMVAAAIDNTLGPLSMLVAPLNYTRNIEIKYIKAITSDLGNIVVVGKYIKCNKRRLYFEANVFDEDEKKILAAANSIHWMVN